MAIFTVQDIVRATQGALVVGDLAVPVSGVAIDSRSLGVGEAFFAIQGHRLDGHDFVAEAASRGASCLVVHHVPDPIPAGVPLVLVEDTTRALGHIAAYHRQRFAIPVVAVTGSNGKTTTKEMIAAVLGTRWRVLKPEASFNNQWGLPLTLLKLTADHEAVVLEIGTNHKGEIATLSAVAAPTIGVVTTVAPVHTEFLGSLDGVREEKAALVRAVAADGCVVLNADDARVAGMARETNARVVTYGRQASATVRVVGDPIEEPSGLRFKLEVGAERRDVALGFSGRHNVGNALAAAATGVVVGFMLDEIVRGLESARPAKGRCIWRDAGPVKVLDDTYNANPASVRAALETAALARNGRRLVVVLADMLELGEVTDAAHREVGRQVVASGAAEFVGFGRHMREAVQVARELGLAEAWHGMTFEDTVAHLLKRVTPGDVVLIKGSRGMRMERVADALVARLTRPDQR